MSQSIDIYQRAHDIAFAVFRVAALIKHPKLKSELESAAVLLVSKNNSQAVDKLGNLVRLAEVVGEIKPINSEVLQRELKGFNLAIAELIGNAEEINLEETFPNKDVKENKVEGVSINKENKQFGNRQSAILEFIRQLPNGCRMRDLVIKFPQVSERTLRNDLQSLTDQSLIERVGSQGPFSFFRAVTKKELIAL